MLASFIRRAVAHKAGYHDATYTRRNRRRMNETMSDTKGRILGRVIAPGYIKPIPSIHFYRDTSGSVSDHDLAMATTFAQHRMVAEGGLVGTMTVITDSKAALEVLNRVATGSLQACDGLAVLARRNREMGVDEVTNARMIAALREDAKGLIGQGALATAA